MTASPAVATVNAVSTVYIGSESGTFYALNAVTGQVIWSFPVGAQIHSSAAVATVNGVSTVYFGAANATLYALNAATGALIWRSQLGDPNQGYEIWSSPAVYNNVVYVGVASHNDQPCVIGQVVARDATNGNPVWNFLTIDQSSCPMGTCVGAGVWASPAIDTTMGVLYVGTGNPGSTCTPSTANATRYPDSVLAFSLGGQLLNWFQAVSNDMKDQDFGSSPVLYSTSQIPCTGPSTQFTFVSEASKNSNLYTFQTGPAALAGGALSAFSFLPSGGTNEEMIEYIAADQHVHQLYWAGGTWHTADLTASANALNVDDGNALKFPLDGSEIISSPALMPYTTQPSCPSQGAFGQDAILVPTTGGNLYRVDEPWSNPPSPPILSWEFDVGAYPLFSAPASIQDLVFFGGGTPGLTDDNRLHAVTTSGSPVYTFLTGGAIASGPAISNGRIYFGSSDDYVYCLSINGQ